MKLILVDLIHDVTKEYIGTEVWPLIATDGADFRELRERGLHIPTLVRTGRADFRDAKESQVLKSATLSKQGSFLVKGLSGAC